MAKMTVVVRTLYLYLFSMVGLIFMAIGGVQLLDMGLRALVFKQADAMERLEQPPMPMFVGPRAERFENDTSFTADEKATMRQALQDYKQWEERRKKIDPVVARRQRTAANALALILIGLPIYLYHWRLIRNRKRRPDSAESL
jgi:hypothetical protein